MSSERFPLQPLLSSVQPCRSTTGCNSQQAAIHSRLRSTAQRSESSRAERGQPRIDWVPRVEKGRTRWGAANSTENQSERRISPMAESSSEGDRLRSKITESAPTLVETPPREPPPTDLSARFATISSCRTASMPKRWAFEVRMQSLPDSRLGEISPGLRRAVWRTGAAFVGSLNGS